MEANGDRRERERRRRGIGTLAPSSLHRSPRYSREQCQLEIAARYLTRVRVHEHVSVCVYRRSFCLI